MGEGAEWEVEGEVVVEAAVEAFIMAAQSAEVVQVRQLWVGLVSMCFLWIWGEGLELTVCRLCLGLRLLGLYWVGRRLRLVVRTRGHLVLAVSFWLGRRRICPL